MSVFVAGLLLAFLAYALLLGVCLVILVLLPSSFLGTPAKAVLAWLPPFLRGEALRDWAASTAERLAKKSLSGKRTAKTGAQLAKEMEEGAMHAILPTAGPSDLERILACPEEGQGMVGVTAPEALNIVAYLRKNRTPAEQRRIYEMARENVNKMALNKPAPSAAPHLPCPLQGESHVCCVYGARPLQCRPLHAIELARNLSASAGPTSEHPGEAGHELNVANGVGIGLTRALRSAGLDDRVYELNWALATALEKPDAAERWAKGENVFYTRKA